MTVRDKLDGIVYRFFSGYSSEESGYYNGNQFFYNGKLNKSISIKSSENNEIPVFCLDYSIHYLTKENSEVVIPLTYNISSETKVYKTTHMLFYHLIRSPRAGNRLNVLRSSTGELFYGASGILLDSNKNPLMLATVKTSGIRLMKLEELILYISPSIFTNNGVVDKYLKDKVLPRILSGVNLDSQVIYDRYVTDRVNIDSNGRMRSAVPRIIISDSINNFFTTTVDDNNDNASEIVLNNLEDFLKCIES